MSILFMQLKRLEIDLQGYGDDKGKYKSTVRYQNPDGEIVVFLNPKVSDELLEFIAPKLNSLAVEAVGSIQQSIVQSAIKK
jgi:hypothetical protein